MYVEYLMKALPPIARAVSSSPDAYVYLAESIRAWPDQAALADLVGAAGWQPPGVAQPVGRHRRPAPRHGLSERVIAGEHDRPEARLSASFRARPASLNAQVKGRFIAPGPGGAGPVVES